MDEEFSDGRRSSRSGRETMLSSLHFRTWLSQPMRGRAHSHAPTHFLPRVQRWRTPCWMAVHQASDIYTAMLPVTTAMRNTMRHCLTAWLSLISSTVQSPFSGS